MNRTALVTGSSSGIGLAIAQRLLEDGWRVIGLSRRAAPLAASGYRSLRADLGDPRALEQALDELLATEAAIDALIACAGAGRFGALEQLAAADIDAQLQLNLAAPIRIARRLLPGMKRRGRGDLLFIGSETALRGGRYGSVYTAAKSGLRGFTRALREETASAGLRVMLINPGMTRSPFHDHADFAPGDDPANALLPDQIAEAAVSMLNTAQNLVVDELNLSPLKKVVRKKRRSAQGMRNEKNKPS